MQQEPESSGTPVQNPLQAALDAASRGPRIIEGQIVGPTIDRRGQQRRRWQWYDEDDEREERQKERRRAQYGNAGTAHLMGIQQSMKKMQRVINLVRGLHYEEAISQCQLVPHKAAKSVVQALEHAKKDAEDKGLKPQLLVVGEIYVTKGVYEKRQQPAGKAATGKLFTRHSHLRVVLREDAQYKGFRARLVAPIMERWQSPAAQALRERPRFEHRIEA